ncbi:protein 5NUC-like protein, partial [Leptotrombidium deliense]
VKYDLPKPVGNKVEMLEIRCGEDCRVPQFSPVDDSKIYNVLTTDYHANDGDLYTMLTAFKETPLKTTITECVIDYILKHSPIYTGLESRSQFVKDREQCE